VNCDANIEVFCRIPKRDFKKFFSKRKSRHKQAVSHWVRQVGINFFLEANVFRKTAPLSLFVLTGLVSYF
jgi:hypothetical protein